MLLPKPNQSEFEIVPAGTYVARCYRFLDLGTQIGDWKGQTKLVRKVRLSWELPTELMTKGDSAGKPFTFHQTYTWSMSEKSTLRKVLESWRGKSFTDADFGAGGFDTHKLLGAPCMLGVSNFEKEGKLHDKISSISPLLKGYQMPQPINETLYFSFDELAGIAPATARQLLDELFGKLSQGTRDTLSRSPEYQKAVGNEHVEEERDDPPASLPDDAYASDIPF